MLVLAAKLDAASCANRLRPDYIERGYVAADWRVAKLMISLFWRPHIISLDLLLAETEAAAARHTEPWRSGPDPSRRVRAFVRRTRGYWPFRRAGVSRLGSQHRAHEAHLDPRSGAAKFLGARNRRARSAERDDPA